MINFFRAAMEHQAVAIDFFNHHLPDNIKQALNIQSLKLIQQSYIDNDLQESISDLVFSCELADKRAYLTLLVEHQSTPDRMLAFRAHHYQFGLLHSYRRQYPDRLLPAVYTLVFYHGATSPYPYSLDLLDCFDDPLGLMQEVLYHSLPLIDVNQLSDEQLKQQQWVGPMVLALKYIRAQDITPYALDILSSLVWHLEQTNTVELLQLLIKYLLNVGNIDDIDAFIDKNTEQLSDPIRSEIMTAAEKLRDLGRQEGIEAVALAMLREGANSAFVSKVTDLPVATIERLRASLTHTS